jgi:hypothetical protein
LDGVGETRVVSCELDVVRRPIRDEYGAVRPLDEAERPTPGGGDEVRFASATGREAGIDACVSDEKQRISSRKSVVGPGCGKFRSLLRQRSSLDGRQKRGKWQRE